ncbi:MAG: type 4a pilus biogenesis protein PilO [Gemmatimonadales bacterium]|jgi:type IV pilus assembly protein PilO|nr:type 4a pilus biogenesis protein PilO [Gemmatimonadales bacterium]MDG2241022.1 type 4a pilus biogenesis protein PilO [Longimicrobiales bacterium]MBT3499699.1 type 4a pilus biogenesis protein PilO [Gemmatimonadales bacterium]MBT3776147.1 type 4a pilus biogenesis protein PilO [Gemmatimonadales bacterium]MBT3959380.1 type 4a pilus biogenesis protein PilO [Gemmatimonadales bacterium]
MAWYNPSDPKQRNLMLGGIAFLIAIVPFRMYMLSPRVLENTAVQEHVESLEGQNRRASVQAARGGGELEERNAIYERHVQKLEELIPAAEEVASLVNDISGAARAADVEPIRMVPEPAETGAFYSKTSYDMAVIGDYHNVARFLTNVGSLSRIVTPVEVDIQVYDQADRYPEMVTPVVVTFRIETYVLPDQPAAPPPAVVPGG